MSTDVTAPEFAPTRARLQDALSAFDGKAVSVLCEAKVQLREAPGFWDALFDLITDDAPMVQAGATWLVRQSLECGDLALDTAMAALAKRLDGLTHWTSLLHGLQTIDAVDRPLPEGPELARFAQAHIAHERPFVRAWAVNALCVLAIHHPDFRAAADTARTHALNDTAASVRARARKAPSPVPVTA